MAQQSVVVLGASNDRNKYGNKAVRAYIKQGWTVYPVNPNESEIEGLKCYKSVGDVPRPVDRVTVYLPPPVAVKSLSEIAKIKPDELFINPGAESDELVAQTQKLGLDPILACSIIDLGVSPAQFSS